MADALHEEYKAITDAGLVVQVDDAILTNLYDQVRADGKDYRRWVAMNIEALNHGLRGIPEDRVRYHLCWGSWPGPHTSDVPLREIVDLLLKINAQAYSIEAANPRHDRHCSLYDVPRAGINIGDGCWGGHVIEFCDIFDTVKETGDHGSFNSWGRDRFWGLDGLDLNNDQAWEANKDVVLLDAVKTTILRNNRWRCDHGWDIDLDDGSSNYEIYNNLCLNGGLKNREGFYRVVENNIMVNNGFHPHVWYKHSEDVVRRNIMWTDHYLPAGGMPATPWGKEMDYNLVHREGVTAPEPAAKLAEQSKRDAHSIVADAMFVDPANGDFRVKEGSPALKLGFVNFPMDQFGVQKPELKAIARTPEMPKLRHSDRSAQKANCGQASEVPLAGRGSQHLGPGRPLGLRLAR